MNVGGRAFHSDAPENENAFSPNFIRMRAMLVDDRRRIDLIEASFTMSARYNGELPLYTECLSTDIGHTESTSEWAANAAGLNLE